MQNVQLVNGLEPDALKLIQKFELTVAAVRRPTPLISQAFLTSGGAEQTVPFFADGTPAAIRHQRETHGNEVEPSNFSSSSTRRGQRIKGSQYIS